MANLNQTTLSDAVKTMYEKRLLTRAIPRLVHGRWAMKARLNKYGSYELRRYSSLSAVTTALTEGTTPSEQTQPTITVITSTPSWYGSWIGYTDELDMTNYDPVVSETASILGEQCGLSADTLVRNTLVASATIDWSNGAAARTSLTYPGHEISYIDVVKQIAQLEAQSALPVDGDDFVMIIHPHTWTSLMSDSTFVNLFTEDSPDSALRSGYVGRIMRCKVFVSSNVREWADGGSGTTDVYSALFIGYESYGCVGIANTSPDSVDSGPANGKPLTGQKVKPVEIIMKALGSAGADDPLNQRGTVAWKMTLDTQILNANWIRSLEHTNVFSNS